MELKDIRTALERKRGSQESLKKDIKTLSNELRQTKRSVLHHEKAKEIIREVGIKTQEQLQYHISDITSLALESVFPDPYKLVLDFVQRREKTECDILFQRGKDYIEPISASGGGAVDLAAFALRIASWSLMRPNKRPIIILDEPMRFVSEDLQEKASLMIKEVSRKLGIQFIIITHEPALAIWADKIFSVSIKKGVSRVTT